MDCINQVSLAFTSSQILLKPMPIESVMPSNHLILCCRLLLPPSVFSSIRVFSDESALGIRWPKYWSFSSSISPSNEYSGLISFRMNWLDLLAVQGTRKSLFQHHSSKESILQCSAFLIVQLSHPYMTTISVQFSHSVMSNSLQPHEPQHTRPPCPSPAPGVHPNPSTSIESVMPSNHLILCHPLLLVPSIFPSIRVFSNESALRLTTAAAKLLQSCPALCDPMDCSPPGSTPPSLGFPR